MLKQLTWTTNAFLLVKKVQQKAFPPFLPSFVRKLEQAKLPQKLLLIFYMSTVETILKNCTTVWYATCTVIMQKDLHCVLKVVQRIVKMQLPQLDMIYATGKQGNQHNLIQDKPWPIRV